MNIMPSSYNILPDQCSLDMEEHGHNMDVDLPLSLNGENSDAGEAMDIFQILGTGVLFSLLVCLLNCDS